MSTLAINKETMSHPTFVYKSSKLLDSLLDHPTTKAVKTLAAVNKFFNGKGPKSNFFSLKSLKTISNFSALALDYALIPAYKYLKMFGITSSLSISVESLSSTKHIAKLIKYITVRLIQVDRTNKGLRAIANCNLEKLSLKDLIRITQTLASLVNFTAFSAQQIESLRSEKSDNGAIDTVLTVSTITIYLLQVLDCVVSEKEKKLEKEGSKTEGA